MRFLSYTVFSCLFCPIPFGLAEENDSSGIRLENVERDSWPLVALISSPERFKDKKISTVGYMERDYIRTLYMSKQAAEDFFPVSSIHLDFRMVRERVESEEGMAEVLQTVLKQLDGKNVRVYGEFMFSRYDHSGGMTIRVENISLWPPREAFESGDFSDVYTEEQIRLREFLRDSREKETGPKDDSDGL